MKRLGQRLLKFAMAASLTLFVVVAFAWPLSYWRGVTVRRLGISSTTTLSLGSGQLSVQGFPVPGSEKTRYEWSVWSPRSPASAQAAVKRIVNLYRAFSDSGAIPDQDRIMPRFEDIYFHTDPLWVPLLIFAWPIIPLAMRYFRKPLEPNHCKACGYDLRATPELCPECGSIPVPENGAVT